MADILMKVIDYYIEVTGWLGLVYVSRSNLIKNIVLILKRNFKWDLIIQYEKYINSHVFKIPTLFELDTKLKQKEITNISDI